MSPFLFLVYWGGSISWSQDRKEAPIRSLSSPHLLRAFTNHVSAWVCARACLRPQQQWNSRSPSAAVLSPWHLRTKPEKNAKMNPSHIKYLFFGHFHPSCSPCIFFKTLFFAFRCAYLIIHTSIKKKNLSKATGLCDRSSSGRGWGWGGCTWTNSTCVHVATWQHGDRHCLSALAVICFRFVQWLTAQPPLGISAVLASPVGVTLWLSPPLTLPARRATGEEVSGHLALPLHLDKTAAVQLVSIAVKHVVKVCGHLTEDTDIDSVRHPFKTKHKHHSFRVVNVVLSNTKMVHSIYFKLDIKLYIF